MNKHTPVYLSEVLAALEPASGQRYIDATLGEGGYTQAFLDVDVAVLALDADSIQVKKADVRFADYKKQYQGAHANFVDIEQVAKKHDFVPADAIVYDLGLSYTQMMENGKGLSYKMEDEPLDMRLGQDQEHGITAADVLNTYDEQGLYQVFAKYAEELRSADLAKRVVASRIRHPYRVVGDLVTTVHAVLGRAQSSMARVFQALRIVVNNEIENLRASLKSALSILTPGGRLAVVTFHSLEDRVVKQCFAQNERVAKHQLIVKDRPLSFEASAKLRLAIVKS